MGDRDALLGKRLRPLELAGKPGQQRRRRKPPGADGRCVRWGAGESLVEPFEALTQVPADHPVVPELHRQRQRQVGLVRDRPLDCGVEVLALCVEIAKPFRCSSSGEPHVVGARPTCDLEEVLRMAAPDRISRAALLDSFGHVLADRLQEPGAGSLRVDFRPPRPARTSTSRSTSSRARASSPSRQIAATAASEKPPANTERPRAAPARPR